MACNQTKYLLELLANYFEQNPNCSLTYDSKDNGITLKLSKNEEVFLEFGGQKAAKYIREYLKQ